MSKYTTKIRKMIQAYYLKVVLFTLVLGQFYLIVVLFYGVWHSYFALSMRSQLFIKNLFYGHRKKES